MPEGFFALVAPKRQAWILREMERTGDYSVSFARALVLRTPPELRSTQRRRRSPWDGEVDEKQQLVAKLETMEKRYDFHTGLYRQYAFDLLRLCIWVRKLTANERVRAYLQAAEPEILARFERILFETHETEEEALTGEVVSDGVKP